MRRITEFKGYRTIIAYDAEAKCFSAQRIASAMDNETVSNVIPEPEHQPQKRAAVSRPRPPLSQAQNPPTKSGSAGFGLSDCHRDEGTHFKL